MGVDLPGLYIGTKSVCGRRAGAGYFAVPLDDQGDSGGLRVGGEAGSGRRVSGEATASLVSRLLFMFVNPLIALGYTRALTEADMSELMAIDDPATAYAVLERAWARGTGESVLWGLVRGWGWAHARNWTYLFVATAAELAGPVFIHAILHCLTPGSPCGARVWLFVAALAGAQVVRIIASARFSYFMKRYATAAKSALQLATYAKVLRITRAAAAGAGVGSIVNHVGVDAGTMREAIASVHLAVITPLQLAVGFYLLFSYLGVAVLAGMATLAVLFPLNLLLAHKLKRVEAAVMTAKDARNAAIADAFGGVRVVKLMAWVPHFAATIQALRIVEQRAILVRGMFRGAARLLNAVIPSLVSATTFAAYVAGGNDMTPAVTFASLSLFGILQGPLDSVARELLTAYSTGKTAAARLTAFESLPELERPQPRPGAAADEPVTDVVAVTGSYAWTPDDVAAGDAVLLDLDLELVPGTLTLIGGPVGSGKTATLLAALGELEAVESDNPFALPSLGRRIAFAPQRPWILSASIRANILLGAEYEAEWYEHVVGAAGLEHDLGLFPAGDATEVGEKGVTLSGGQKQRVALARVLYARPPIAVLDDPLSAVDPALAAHIFEAAIVPLAATSLVVMATHSPTLLATPGVRVYMIEAGRASLAPPSLLHGDAAAPAAIVDPASPPPTPDGESSGSAAAFSTAAVAAGKKLTKAEDRAKGSVLTDHYKAYGRAVGVKYVCGLVGLLLTGRAVSVWRDMWLTEWANASRGGGQVDNSHYLGGYFGLIAASAFLTAATAVVTVVASAAAGSIYHAQALAGVLGSPLAFFDATPLGRILNRFSKDMATMDSGVLPVIVKLAVNGVQLVAILTVIGITIPWFLLASPAIALLFYPISVLYQHSKRELQRTMSVVNSPLFAHVAASVDGLVSVRAYNVREAFTAKHVRHVDALARVWVGKVSVNRWLLLRLALIGASIVTLAAVLAVESATRGVTTAASAGLTLMYASQLTAALIQLCSSLTRIEVQMNSVERLGAYGELEPEDEGEVDSELASWAPTAGRIVFADVAVRYRPDLPLVLDGVTLDVAGGTKVGLCGPSGSGKSTLAATLFRTTPLAGGWMAIDGQRVDEIPLHTLRSRLAIIPQDAHLFAGTLRFNLDPGAACSDAAVWRALERVGMGGAVREKSELGLELAVKGNFSAGEAQLLCMARALLRNAKIIVCDEATASVDAESDARIQDTIRTAFAECTIITIAHRIDTIVDYDRIIVLEDGAVVEDGAPGALLADAGSRFARIAAGRE